MSCVNLVLLLLRMDKRHLLKNIVVIILCSVSFTVIHMAIFEVTKSNFEITVIKSFFSDRDRFYNINAFMDNNTYDYELYLKEFVESLSGVEGVTMSGIYYKIDAEFDGLKESEDFLKYNQTLLKDTSREGYPSLISICYVDKSMLSLLGLDDLKRPKLGDVYPMLVGYDYKEFFEEGKIYKDSSGIRYKVCGTLPKDFKIPAYDLFWSEMPYENLNKYVVTINDYGDKHTDRFITNACNSIYCETDGKIETEENIRKLARQLFIHISLNTINDKIELYKTQEQNNRNITLLFAVIITISAVVAVLATSIVQIIINKQSYGIIYANGVSFADVVLIILIRNTFCMMISFFIATFIAINNINAASFFQSVSWVDIFIKTVVGKTSVIVLFLLFISVVVPSCILGNMKIIDLLRGNEL